MREDYRSLSLSQVAAGEVEEQELQDVVEIGFEPLDLAPEGPLWLKLVELNPQLVQLGASGLPDSEEGYLEVGELVVEGPSPSNLTAADRGPLGGQQLALYE